MLYEGVDSTRSVLSALEGFYDHRNEPLFP
jgi:hypothetical protein